MQCIAENVVGLDISYFDGELWQSDWPEDEKTWPVAFRIRLVVVDPKTPKNFWTAQRIVTHPRLAAQSGQQQQQEGETR